jgi:hypothetical protein
MGTEKWDTFGNSCYMTEDTSKGVWWNWNEKQKYASIEDAIMDYLYGTVLKSFLDKKCCNEMVVCGKPANYVSPWKEPFGRYIENTNTNVSMLKEFIYRCQISHIG